MIPGLKRIDGEGAGIMTLHEAYLKAKSYGAKIGLTHLVSCWDYGDFWGFCFIPFTTGELNGLGDITVNKRTGNIGSFTPTMDLDLAEKARSIPVEQFTEYNVAI